MERVVEAELRNEEAGVRVAVLRRLARAGLREFCSEFARRYGLVEKDSVRAVGELPALQCVLQESLDAYGEVLEMPGIADLGASAVERGEDRGRG